MIKILKFYKKLIKRGTGETCFHTRKNYTFYKITNFYISDFFTLKGGGKWIQLIK